MSIRDDRAYAAGTDERVARAGLHRRTRPGRRRDVAGEGTVWGSKPTWYIVADLFDIAHEARAVHAEQREWIRARYVNSPPDPASASSDGVPQSDAGSRSPQRR